MNKLIKIQSRIENLRIVENAIDEISTQIGINQDNYGKIMVCTMEAVNNAVVHGNKSIESKNVEIEISQLNNTLEISVQDEGPGFRAELVPDPTNAENIENVSGRGVFLMMRLADKIEFNDPGNKVTMSFKI
jgi:serine/threonine-protein kinase RsbW